MIRFVNTIFLPFVYCSLFYSHIIWKKEYNNLLYLFEKSIIGTKTSIVNTTKMQASRTQRYLSFPLSESVIPKKKENKISKGLM